jgi:hypothetical protein
MTRPRAATRRGWSSLGRYCAKLLFKFEQSVRDKVVGNWLPVIEPEREQNLVSPE